MRAGPKKPVISRKTGAKLYASTVSRQPAARPSSPRDNRAAHSAASDRRLLQTAGETLSPRRFFAGFGTTEKTRPPACQKIRCGKAPRGGEAGGRGDHHAGCGGRRKPVYERRGARAPLRYWAASSEGPRYAGTRPGAQAGLRMPSVNVCTRRGKPPWPKGSGETGGDAKKAPSCAGRKRAALRAQSEGHGEQGAGGRTQKRGQGGQEYRSTGGQEAGNTGGPQAPSPQGRPGFSGVPFPRPRPSHGPLPGGAPPGKAAPAAVCRQAKTVCSSRILSPMAMSTTPPAISAFFPKRLPNRQPATTPAVHRTKVTAAITPQQSR